MQDTILHEPEIFIGEASKGEVVVLLFRTLSNEAYGSLRLVQGYMILRIPLIAWLIRMLFSIRAKRT
jgi:hypothetical protein